MTEQTTTALGELLQKHLEQKTVEPVAPKYTLEEALPLIKEQHKLFTLKEAIELLENANSAWEEIRNCHVCRAILDQYYSGCVYQDRDFFDLDIEDFINSCNAITENPDDVKAPESLVDDCDLEEYFCDNASDFWEKIDWSGSINKDDVLEAYLENGCVDLDEYIENFKL